jgi:ribosomal protein S18 acetylase RimI-like enzyme
MEVRSRRATPADVPALAGLYSLLAGEMAALKAVWPLADGLEEPIRESLSSLLTDPDAALYLGEIDGYPFGFLLARSEPLLAQAGGERIGSIRLIFTDPEAREVGIGEAIIEQFLDEFRAAGHRRFDAHVPPGHREAKNFFESNGFAARRIVMHRPEGRE